MVHVLNFYVDQERNNILEFMAVECLKFFKNLLIFANKIGILKEVVLRYLLKILILNF